jgi:hypothetical protein
VGETIRRYRGQRWLRIALRTGHIAAAALILGAAHFVSPEVARSHDAVALLVGTGGAILVDDAYRYGTKWLRMAQCWGALLKVALFCVGLVRAEWLLPCAWTALVLGSLVSHAPGDVRHYKLWGAR